MVKSKKPSSKLRLLKIPTSLYLDPPQHAALQALSKRTRVKMQDYVREGLDIVLAKYGEKK